MRVSLCCAYVLPLAIAVVLASCGPSEPMDDARQGRIVLGICLPIKTLQIKTTVNIFIIFQIGRLMLKAFKRS